MIKIPTDLTSVESPVKQNLLLFNSNEIQKMYCNEYYTIFLLSRHSFSCFMAVLTIAGFLVNSPGFHSNNSFA
jgi:hypothetical protein